MAQVHEFQVSRFAPGVTSSCHGSTCVKVPGETGMVDLPLDWLAGEVVPVGATVRITVEITDRGTNELPLNLWHQKMIQRILNGHKPEAADEEGRRCVCSLPENIESRSVEATKLVAS